MSNNSPNNDKNKFLFNLNNFDPTDNVVEEEIVEEIDVPPPAPTFSEDEMDAARAIAHSNGMTAGKTEEKGNREQQLADTLEKIADTFSSAFAAETYRERQYEEESIRLGLELVKKLAPTLQDLLGEDTLKSMMKDELLKQGNQSEITIEVNPDSTNDIDTYISTIWRDKENAPNYRVLANSEIKTGACDIKWADGGMIRDPVKTANAIEESLKSLIKEKKPTQTPTINASLDDKDENQQDDV